MGSISTAIGSQRVSRVSGYKLNKGFFSNATPNLPQIVVMLGEANDANQTGIDVTKKVQIVSAAQAGQTYGYGSPIHQMARIMFPISGGGIGGVPVLVMPQLAAGGATPTAIVWTITGTATANATHTVIINGRDNVDFQSYSFNVAIGDTPTAIAVKLKNAVNAVLGSPVTAANTAGVVTFTTKWSSATSANTNVSVSNNSVPAGVTYAQTSNTAGTGAADISAALAQFENNWYTTVINPYGSAQLAGLEAFNGYPDNLAPTGRYAGEVFKPFMAFFGSTVSNVSDFTAITDATARKGQVTNVLCPAPGSLGFPWEAAANVVSLFAPIMQDTPHLDVNAQVYPDMPTPSVLGDMAVYSNRDILVQKGCSTVSLVNGKYKIQDLVTTYHPDGETQPLQFSYCRNLNLDWNVRDGYGILENLKLKDKVLIADGQVASVSNVIRPSDWKATIFAYFDELAQNALLNDPKFSKASLQVQVSPNNPNRFETTFNYKRTGIARIESTDVYAGF